VLAVPPALVDAASREMLRRGLDALAAGDMTEARAARDLLARGSLDREAMIWAIANHSDGRASSAEIAEAAKVLRGWPGLERLRLAGERALYWEKAAPQTVVEAFGAAPPETRRARCSSRSGAGRSWALRTSGSSSRSLPAFFPRRTTATGWSGCSMPNG
jgi:soluble lytic murein transglycosylase